MKITELREMKLIPIIRSEIYENKTKHWWMIEDRRKDFERLYRACRYPISSRIGFDTFADCMADLNNVINSIVNTKSLNEQFNNFLNEDN